MSESCEIAIVGSGFAGSLLARVLARIGYDVVLLERGSHPRFAIGESSTPLANLSLERIALRWSLGDCWDLATHGRWMERHRELRRGLKRGFTYYRHHPGEPFAGCGLESERLLVAASPDDALADTHWYRADVDTHFVREAVNEGVDYRDHVALTEAEVGASGVTLRGARDGAPLELCAEFVIDASGPAGFLARQLGIPSALARTGTRSALVFSHFEGVRTMPEVVPRLPAGPYPDDRAAVHHIVDEGWMYALRFDHGVTSAGFLLTPRGLASVREAGGADAESLWRRMLARYPTIAAAYGDAKALMPLGFVPQVQHRLARAAGARWAMLPHAFAFVDPLFSTGIAWGLRAVERLGLAFAEARRGSGMPCEATLARYDAQLAAEADQVDRLVAGAYEAMGDFETFAAHAMLYFATVSWAEIGQRVRHDEHAAWAGFLGVGDPVLEPLFGEALGRLREIAEGRQTAASFVQWAAEAIEPRNVVGLADPARHNLYPAELETVVAGAAKLGLSHDAMLAALPALRGMSARPSFSRLEEVLRPAPRAARHG